MSKASDALALQILFRNGVISVDEFRVRITSFSVQFECSQAVADCGDYKLAVVPSW